MAFSHALFSCPELFRSFFGLGTAIPTLVLFSLLSGTTQHLIDDINESKTRMLNLLLENRDKLSVADIQG